MIALTADFPVDQLAAFPAAATQFRLRTGLQAALAFYEIDLGNGLIAAETIEIADPGEPNRAQWWLNAAEGGLVAATHMSAGDVHAAASIADALALVEQAQ